MPARTQLLPRLIAGLTLALGVGELGCAAKRPGDDAAASAAALERGSPGSRCEDEGKANFAPFIVDWDAGERATFIDKAARALVFARYRDCQLELLYDCADSQAPDVYGRYEPPTPWSGAADHLEIKNEDELYAKLPLGAGSLARRVQRGETLELRYSVSGVVHSALRSAELAPVVAQNDRCEGATHFVSSYSLGAFELHAGTPSAREELATEGALVDCQRDAYPDAQLPPRCDAPIRLVLQRVDAAGRAQRTAAATTAAANAAIVNNAVQRSLELRLRARDKLRARDSQGCLADLSLADRLHPASRGDRLETRAYCTMLAGDCKGGKQLLREFLVTRDPQRSEDESQLTREVQAAARERCPLDTLATIDGKLERLAAQVREGRNGALPERCVDAAERASALADATTSEASEQRRADARAVLKRAALCLVALGRCDEARTWFLRHERLRHASSRRAPEELDADAAAAFTRVSGSACSD